MVYAIKITDVAQLKQCIIDCWQEIPQEEINKATNAFQRILQKVIKANGENIEKTKFSCFFDQLRMSQYLTFFQFFLY